MPKMSKSQARKRLNEASEKVWKVLGGRVDMTSRDDIELQKARLILIKIASKLK